MKKSIKRKRKRVFLLFCSPFFVEILKNTKSEARIVKFRGFPASDFNVAEALENHRVGQLPAEVGKAAQRGRFVSRCKTATYRTSHHSLLTTHF
ncbi:MAG: hypothetical protein IJM81_05995 [Prevotella sp.]|nr:hypothetical protein [Prevotella sp.]